MTMDILPSLLAPVGERIWACSHYIPVLIVKVFESRMGFSLVCPVNTRERSVDEYSSINQIIFNEVASHGQLVCSTYEHAASFGPGNFASGLSIRL